MHKHPQRCVPILDSLDDTMWQKWILHLFGAKKQTMLPEPVGYKKQFGVKEIVNHPLIWPAVLGIEVLFYSSYAILLNLSRMEGEIAYSSASSVVIIEFIKFFVALSGAWPSLSQKTVTTLKVGNVLPFAVPAVCYCFNNNLAVHMQEHMDPATYQVLSNLKIVSTAILYRIIMKRRLKLIQWLSLLILTFAGGLNSYNGLSEEKVSPTEIHITPVGLFLAMIYCTISGFSGVYTEYILKKDLKVSLSLQNCFMYSFGILLNSLFWLWQTDNFIFFSGYNGFTWAAILCQALNGLVMSVIMKHSNNIVRLFVISSAIPVTTLLSVIVLHLQPNIVFLLVVVLVLIAIYLYHTSIRS